MTQHNTQEDFLPISKWGTGWSCSIPTVGNAKKRCEFGCNYYHATQTWHLKKLRPVLPNLKMPCPRILFHLRLVLEAVKHPRCHFALSFSSRSTSCTTALLSLPTGADQHKKTCLLLCVCDTNNPPSHWGWPKFFLS